MHENGILPPPEEYDGVYSSKADYSSGRLKKKLSSKREKGLNSNSSDSKMKMKRVKNLVKADTNLNLRIEKDEYKNHKRVPKESQEQSRNNSLVVISSGEKHVSKSRPKQRHPKLIEENERGSSVLKILARSDNPDGNTERSSRKK